MGRNHFIDRRVILAAQIESAPHRFDMDPDPLVLGTGHAHLRRRADGYAGAPAADGQADAAEASPEPAVEIQKAEMQPRRNSHGDLRGGRGTTQAFSPEIFPQPGFSNRNTGIDCGTSRALAISDETQKRCIEGGTP